MLKIKKSGFSNIDFTPQRTQTSLTKLCFVRDVWVLSSIHRKQSSRIFAVYNFIRCQYYNSVLRNLYRLFTYVIHRMNGKVCFLATLSYFAAQASYLLITLNACWGKVEWRSHSLVFHLNFTAWFSCRTFPKQIRYQTALHSGKCKK